MGSIERGTDTPQTGIDAAERAFDLSYYTDRDELLAALNAAAPVVRLDEIDGAVEALRVEISRVPPGPEQACIRTGMRAALSLLEARSRDIRQGAGV